MELVRQKNVATIITFPIVDADGDTVTGATALDSEIDTWTDSVVPDGFTDCTNEATEIGATGVYYLSLTQTEMNADYIYIQVKTTSSGAKTQHILIRTIVGDPLNVATTDDGGTINVASGVVEANLTQIGGVAQSATDLKDFADDGYDPITNKVQGVVLTDTVTTYTGNTPQTGDSYAVVTNVTYGLSAIETLVDDLESRLTAARAGYLDELAAANIPADIDTLLARVTALRAGYLDNLSAGAVAQASVCTEARLAELDAANLPTDVANVKTDTGNLVTRVPDTISLANINAQVDSALDTAIPGVPAANSINERVKAIDDKLPSGTISDFDETANTVNLSVTSEAQIDAIEVDTNSLNDTKITTARANNLDNLDAAISTRSTITTAQVNTEVDTALTDVNLDHLVGTATGIPAVPAGTYLDQMMDDGVAVFDRATDSLQAIADSGGGGPTVGQIADAVWDEAIAGHLGAGSTGEALNAAGGAGDPWVTAIPGAYGAGSAGKIVGDALTGHIPQTGDGYPVANSIQSDTNDIQARLPAALVGGRIDASVGAVANNAITAAAIATDAIDADALASDSITEIVNGIFAKVIDIRTFEETQRKILSQIDGDMIKVGGLITYKQQDKVTTELTHNYVGNTRTSL